MAASGQQESPEMVLLRDIRDRVSALERQGLKREAEQAVLRVRMKRNEEDHSDLAKIVTGHARKLNIALGMGMMLGIVGTAIGWFFDHIISFFSNGGRHS